MKKQNFYGSESLLSENWCHSGGICPHHPANKHVGADAAAKEQGCAGGDLTKDVLNSWSVDQVWTMNIFFFVKCEELFVLLDLKPIHGTLHRPNG